MNRVRAPALLATDGRSVEVRRKEEEGRAIARPDDAALKRADPISA